MLCMGVLLFARKERELFPEGDCAPLRGRKERGLFPEGDCAPHRAFLPAKGGQKYTLSAIGIFPVGGAAG